MGRHSLLPALGFVQAEQIRLDPGFQLLKIDDFLSFRKLELYSSLLGIHKVQRWGIMPSVLCPPWALFWNWSAQQVAGTVFMSSSPRYTLFANSRNMWGCVCKSALGRLRAYMCVKTIFPGSLCVGFWFRYTWGLCDHHNFNMLSSQSVIVKSQGAVPILLRGN